MILSCGCCGESFQADKQHWNFDKGYGRCLSCCRYILAQERWKYDHAEIRVAMRDQWKKETVNEAQEA